MLGPDVIAHLRRLPVRHDLHRPELIPSWAWTSQWHHQDGVWMDVLTPAGGEVLAQVERAEKAEAALAMVERYAPGFVGRLAGEDE